MTKLDPSLVAPLAPFRGLERGELREVLDQAMPRRHDEGAAIFGEGHDAERFFLLLDGHVRVVRTLPTGEQVVMRHVPPGELIGIAPALGRTTYPATALAATEALTLSWPVRLWPIFMSRHDGFAAAVRETLGARLEQAHDQVVDLAAKAVEQRVAACLLRMVDQSGRKVGNGIEIAFPLTRANIADMTGTSLFTVSRLLSAWERDGVLESSRKHVVVTDPHRLLMLSGAAG